MRRRRRIRVATCLCVVLTAALLPGCGGKTEVDVIGPQRGEIAESFAEPARTRLARTHPVTMPVNGRIGRVMLEPGDTVSAGQALVELDLVPFQTAVEEGRAHVRELEARLAVSRYNRLEMTALEETEIAVEAAEDALRAADAQVEAQRARSDRAGKELTRMERLAAEQVVPLTTLDDARLDAETALIGLRTQEFDRAVTKALAVITKLGPRAVNEYVARKALERAVIEHGLAQAHAALQRAEHDLALAAVLSPIDGVVLERYEDGDVALPAGRPLLLLGDMAKLEVVADVLTQDAMRLVPGATVSLQAARGQMPIDGKVKRIEPAGFTKLSSLGVEQQRVRVIVALDERPDGLGVGYRLQARFYTGRKTGVLMVPRFSVLQAPDGAFYVLKVAGGRLVKAPVTLGLRSDLEMEVLSGLSETDVVVATPDSTTKPGTKVKVRQDES